MACEGMITYSDNNQKAYIVRAEKGLVSQCVSPSACSDGGASIVLPDGTAGRTTQVCSETHKYYWAKEQIKQLL